MVNIDFEALKVASELKGEHDLIFYKRPDKEILLLGLEQKESDIELKCDEKNLYMDPFREIL